MSTLGLAGNLIDWSEAWPLGLNYGHFQVVHVPDAGEAKEIEVLPSAPQVLPQTGKMFWTYPDGGVPSSHEVDAPVNYLFTPIDFGRSADSAWDILKQVHEQFNKSGTDIQYQYDNNSNSYATTVLGVIGEDIAKYAYYATPVNVDSFPGLGRNILESPEDAIALNIKGIDEGDVIHTGVKDDILTGRAGDDELSGGGGNDKLEGGGDSDTLLGGPGDDSLNGGPDPDPINVDTLTGGPGKDQFWASTGSDVITDFNPEEDSLWLPEDTEGRFNAWANTTMLTYLNGTVALEGVDLGPHVAAKEYPWLEWHEDMPLIA